MSMKVVVFNVEHGFCAFLKTPTRHTILIDCGCTEKFSPALYLEANELSNTVVWDNHKITRMVVTHPHDDHIKDIATLIAHCPPALLRRQTYDWEAVKMGPEEDYESLDTYTRWQASYNRTPVSYPDYGMDVEVFCLSPDQAKRIDEAKYINNSSIVTVATVRGTQFQDKFLFGADMETAGWEGLLDRDDFKKAVRGVHFFITSHHGHSSGFSDALYTAMGGPPILNIVSIHHNDEHVADEYSNEEYASGISEDVALDIDFKNCDVRRMLTTRADGSITVHVTDEGKYWITGAKLEDNR